jgi:hypothetical protein
LAGAYLSRSSFVAGASLPTASVATTSTRTARVPFAGVILNVSAALLLVVCPSL